MNRGNYARASTMRRIVRSFLTAGSATAEAGTGHHVRQIVNLGAGYDTLYFVLKELRESEGLHPFCVYEVDMAPVVRGKVGHIQRSTMLTEVLEKANAVVTCTEAEAAVHAEDYHLFAADLRETGALEASL